VLDGEKRTVCQEIPMTMLVQVDLRSEDRYMTCWVEPKAKVGNRITLKNFNEPDRLWEVLRVGEPRERSSINRGWNNNI